MATMMKRQMNIIINDYCMTILSVLRERWRHHCVDKDDDAEEDAMTIDATAR